MHFEDLPSIVQVVFKRRIQYVAMQHGAAVPLHAKTWAEAESEVRSRRFKRETLDADLLRRSSPSSTAACRASNGS